MEQSLQKCAGKWTDEVKWILDGLKKNSISGPEAARSAAIASISAALAGAGIGAITGKKGDRKRRAIKGALIGGLAGGVAGPAYAQLRKYLDGIKFDNSKFTNAEHKKGDKVYIGVAGSANGEGESWFADEMRGRFGQNAYMLRHVDKNELKKVYDDLKAKGLDVTVVGHSSGGATVGKFLRDNPSAKGYLIDPVSWFGRGVPDNAVVFTADKSTRHGGPTENTIADLGGRWNYEGKNSILFRGSHSNRMEQIIRDFVQPGIRPGDKVDKKPSYVTRMFGKSAAVRDIDRMVKTAQTWGYYAPAHIPQAAMDYEDTRRGLQDDIKNSINGAIKKVKGLRPREFTLEDTAKDPANSDPRMISDPYYHNILVGGANAAGKGFRGWSQMPFGVLSKGSNRTLFRNGEIDKIREEIESLLKSGKKPRVVGHSWGGADVARLSKEYPDIPFVSLDPVSWTGRIKSAPKNLTILRPEDGDYKTRDSLFARLAPIVGRRWPEINTGEGRTVKYRGGHVDGIDDALNRYVFSEWKKRDPSGFQSYIKSNFPGSANVPSALAALKSPGKEVKEDGKL